jgi:hypothetical protein
MKHLFSFYRTTLSRLFFMPLAALSLLLSSTRSSAQVIDIDIRNTTVVTPTQFTFEIWMKAGVGYVTQTAPFNNPNNMEPNGCWTGMGIRVDFSFADPAVTAITSTSQARVPGLSIAGSSVVNPSVRPGTDAGIILSYGRPSDNSIPDLDNNWTKYATVTVNVNAGTVVPSDVAALRIGSPSPTPATSNWTNAASGTRHQYAPDNSNNFPLPLTLTEFTARKTLDGQRSELSWTTVQESGVAFFSVERSTDGKSWEKGAVAGVRAVGTSASRLDYQTYDNEPARGTNYYRLKMVDKNGSFTYSPVRTVNFDQQTQYSLSPNPATDKINVSGIKAGSRVCLFNMAGQQLTQLYANGDSGLTIPVNNLAAGTYQVRVLQGNEIIYTAKFTKVDQ